MIEIGFRKGKNDERSRDDAACEKFKIGRILHLKSEIRDLKLDGPVRGPIRNFEISDLRCRIRPTSNFYHSYGSFFQYRLVPCGLEVLLCLFGLNPVGEGAYQEPEERPSVVRRRGKDERPEAFFLHLV